MYVEQLLCGKDDFYHQNKGNWLEWCKENQSFLYKEYIRRIDCGESVRDFFGDWSNYQGKSDVGYYLGCEFVKTLLEKYTLNQLANLSLSEIEGQLRRNIGEGGKTNDRQNEINPSQCT